VATHDNPYFASRHARVCAAPDRPRDCRRDSDASALTWGARYGVAARFCPVKGYCRAGPSRVKRITRPDTRLQGIPLCADHSGWRRAYAHDPQRADARRRERSVRCTTILPTGGVTPTGSLTRGETVPLTLTRARPLTRQNLCATPSFRRMPLSTALTMLCDVGESTPASW
jgi:hypothetical protein